jgi:hypothetical protein
MLAAEDTTEEAAGDFDSDRFHLILDDEMSPLPPEGEVEEAAAAIPQPLDALTVIDEELLWTALGHIKHFALDVARLRNYYR